MEKDNIIQIEGEQCGAQQATPVVRTIIDSICTVDEIEHQNILVNGCNSNTTDKDLLNDLKLLNITQKKKTRRKRKHKPRIIKNDGKLIENYTFDEIDRAPNSEENSTQVAIPEDTLLNLPYNFKITAISNQTNAKVFRIKNGICCKHINKNFYKNLKKNGIEVSGTLHSFSPCSSKVTVINDSFNKDNCKFSAEVTNGTTDSWSPISQLDNSILQSSTSSTNLQSASASSSPKQKQKVRNRKQKKFPLHCSASEVRDGLECGELVKGIIRINAKNFREAYVSNKDRSQQDYLIQSIADRNQALEGDVVAIKVKPQSEWTEKQKTAFVVHIMEKVHSRTAVGFLHLMPDRNKQFAAFIPRDNRIPKIKIPANMCPPSFHLHPNRYESMLFKAKINVWKEIKHPIGTIIENIGVLGDLESETAAILADNDLDITPFSPELLKIVRIDESIPQKEFEYREDLRKECIFTIDPLTARDLDDAVSCKELDNGNLEIGVHISDVAYYLREGTALDKLVCRKATTIYLVNNVYHMLPRELCLHCSLLPGADKLAFSVFWEMTKSGEIIRHRFARSVINSCTQLAYEHAQVMIENPNYEFKDGELPKIFGGFTYKDLSRTVNYLQAIAVNLRTQRFDRGALRVDQTKLLYKLDEDTGEPSEYFVYENKEANRLIEEFMLLANISVAQRIADDFPDLAFLRCHEPPNERMLADLKRNLKTFKIDLDISSSKAIQSSIWNIENEKHLGICEMAVLNHLIAKPMTRARYFCADETDSEDGYKHYALHVPIYTHFTSPIRRYADIMVHRLLSASLGYTQKPQWEAKNVSEIANNCNKQKYSAKLAGEASSDLYLAHYVVEHQPFIQRAVVIDVKNSSIDILVVGTGSVIRMYTNAFGSDVKCIQEPSDSGRKFIAIFPETPDFPEECYKIQLFSIIKVSLYRRPKMNKLEAKLLRPINSQSFVKQDGNLLLK